MSSQFNYFDNYTNEHPLFLGEYAVIEYDIPGFSSPQWDKGALRAMYPFWYVKLTGGRVLRDSITHRAAL